MSNLLDTILNVSAFAFIGVLVWLYFKKPHVEGKIEDDNVDRESGS